MKTVKVTNYTNQTRPKHSERKKTSMFYSLKILEYLSNMHKTGGAHLQRMNNHYAKFDYKGIKAVGVTD